MGGKFLPKLNTCGRPIANKYREGKMKRTLKRESKVLEIAEIEGMATSRGGAIQPRGCRRGVYGGIGASLPAGWSTAAPNGSGRARLGSGWIRTGRDGRRQGDCPRGQNIQAGVNRRVGIEARICHGESHWASRSMAGRGRRDAMLRVGWRRSTSVDWHRKHRRS